MTTLNEIIAKIQADSGARLSAEARNALHGATDGHPWCHGKTTLQRLMEVQFAIAGRGVHSALTHEIERMIAKEQTRKLGWQLPGKDRSENLVTDIFDALADGNPRAQRED
jgi:hypothetical protein